ncbi:MAG: hypothetical protein ACI845_001483 [Gammaproteobacteria bacterium]|jgi:hypothetical protein
MDWTSILWAGLLAVFVIMMFPRAKQTIEDTPKGSHQDWMGFIIPMVVIVLFIVLLIKLV